jgi:glycerophosphoryl diester phosphodiesterase
MSRVSDIGFIKEAYRRLFYAQGFVDSFETLVTKQQNETISILNKSASNTNSHQYATIRDSLEELNSRIKDYGLAKMDRDIFGQSAPENAIDCVNEYIKQCNTMFIGDSISGEAVNLVMYTCNWIRDVHENILSGAKMAIIDACLGRINDNGNQ